MRRIDAHNHIAMNFLPDIRAGHTSQTAEELIADLDRLEFDQAVVFPEPYDWNYRALHDEMAEAIRRHPDRLVPLALVNPREGKPGLDEAERCIREYGARAIKFRPDSQACPANSDAVRAVLALADRLHVPVFIHSGYSVQAHPLTIGDLVRDFPTLPIVMQHMFDLTGKHSVKVAKRNPNVSLETSGVYSPYLIREAIETLGPDRVMFGSDSPYLPRGLELFKITCLHLPPAVEQRVLGENAAAFLGI
ncbi:MAG: amidohydrolase family protein [Thermomicrobiales bacterium]